MTEDYEPISQDMQIHKYQYDPLRTCSGHLGMASECPKPASGTLLPSRDGWQDSQLSDKEHYVNLTMPPIALLTSLLCASKLTVNHPVRPYDEAAFPHSTPQRPDGDFTWRRSAAARFCWESSAPVLRPVRDRPLS